MKTNLLKEEVEQCKKGCRCNQGYEIGIKKKNQLASYLKTFHIEEILVYLISSTIFIEMKYEKEINDFNEEVINKYENFNLLLSKAKIENKEIFGVCLILLNSSFDLYKAINILLNRNLLESGGIILTSLWERVRTLEYILNKPEERTEIYLKHSKLKKTPWNIRQIVEDIIKNDTHPKITVNNQTDLLYLHYSFLSAIKHGNPYTLTVFTTQSKKENLNFSNNDLDTFLLTFTLNTIIEGLLKFVEYFCEDSLVEEISNLNENYTKFILKMDLNVPQIISTSSDEFRDEFWNYLDEISEKVQRK